MIVDLFAGPGGWDEGLLSLGRTDVVGVEWDEAACETARAAGHERIQGDVSEIDPADFSDVEGLIASPPCQAYSMAGKGLGRADKPLVIACAHELALGNDTRAERRAECKDARSILTVEPLRWALALRPRWIAMEQVPAVLELWTVFAELLEAHGYHATAGTLSAEEYGVPQTRKRAYLVASLDGRVALPTPTHERYRKGHPRGATLNLLPWVSMAEALGWGMTERPYYALATAGGKRGGADEQVGGSGARRGLYGERDAGRWAFDRPSTAVCCDPRIMAPGWHDPNESGSQMKDAVRVTVEEASILMGFRPDYPWQGPKTKKFQQIGNAVCPPVGAAVLTEAMRPTRERNCGGGDEPPAWVHERPAPTIVTTRRSAGGVVVGRQLPRGEGRNVGGHGWANGPKGDGAGVRVSPAEASVLMGFRADYPWVGTLSKRLQQIGNAVCPPMATTVLREAMRPTVGRLA